MAKFAGPRLPPMMKALFATQSSAYEMQRVSSTAFLAEVGATCSGSRTGTAGAPPRQAGSGHPLENLPQAVAAGARVGLGQELQGGQEPRLGTQASAGLRHVPASK